MGKKLTYEFVKKYLETNGYKLLSKEYVNAFYNLKYECPNGHIGYIKWNSFQQGHRCSICQNQISPSIENIKKSFILDGYTLLSEEYKNRQSKLEYKCANGHIRKMTWANWCRGRRCPKCAKKEKYKLEDVKNGFEKEGFILLSKKYINSETPLDYICPNGHKNKITWYHWLRGGQRCRECSYRRWQGKNNPKWKGHSSKWLSEYRGYVVRVSVITRRNYNKYTDIINPLNLDKQKHHVDHIYSIHDGFNNNIKPEIIASPVNLRIISCFDNLSKGKKSDISKDELYFLYNKFISEIDKN